METVVMHSRHVFFPFLKLKLGSLHLKHRRAVLAIKKTSGWK